jgi:hypothetical protein
VSTENENAGLEEQAPADVERIRDIIFGSQMRQYDQHFKRVAGQVELLGKQLEELRAAFDQDQAGRLDQGRELQGELRKLQGQVGKTLDELRGDLTGRLEKQEADTQAQARKLAADLRQQGLDVRNELTAALQNLEDEATNRHDLGDLLIEMGMRLKEKDGIAGLLDQLEQAADTPPDG